MEQAERTIDVDDPRQASAWLSGQNRALELIASGASLREILTHIVLFIESQTQGLAGSVLLLVDGHLRHGAAPSLPAEYNATIDGITIGPSVGACGAAAFHKRPVIATDIASDPNWAPFRELALRHGLRACWSTPILANSGDVVGTFAMYYAQPGAPRPTDLRLVEIATHLAGIAIAHIRTEEALKLRAEQLLDSDRRKDEFLAMLAHELRNPLAPILAAADLMATQRADSSTFERFRQVIQRQARHLSRLVDDLLDVSRITRGAISLTPTRITAAALLEGTMETARPSIEARQHHLTIELPTQPIELLVDPGRIAQVLSNILINAAKFTEPGGQLRVRVAQDLDQVVFAIQDNGVGIDPAMLSKIFELFAQANPTLARTQSGLGIGLTVAKRLVEMHGGSLTASSAGHGQGSEFVVRLPAAPPLAEKPETSPAAPAAAPAAGPRRVLVVDDNADAADLLAIALEDAGYTVRVARDGHEAIASASAWQPDALILDIGLPGLDGFEVARRLRNEQRLTCTIIALSGYGQAHDRARSAAVGIDVHLVKPVDIDALVALVAQINGPSCA